MTTQQIESFLILCETLNFSKTAQLCHISQSVVSRHIAQMETELGFRLFDRTKHKVSLTDSGEIMYRHYSKAAAEGAAAIKMARRVSDPGLASLSIRLLDLFDNDKILSAISIFPQTTFHIERFTHPCHSDDLLSGYYDVGIGYRDELCATPEILYQEISNSRDNLICAKNYKRPKRGFPSIYLVSDDMRNPANVSGKRFEQLGLDNYQIQLVPNIASALTAVESGMGYCVLKDFSLPYVRFEYQKIMLNVWQSIGIAWVADPKRPYIQRFAEACIKNFS